MKLLEWEGEFIPEDTSTHREIFFVMPAGVNRLRIMYAYDPKQYAGEDATDLVEACYARYGYTVDKQTAAKETPLNNHITLSLDAPNGQYVGAAHRHPNRQTIELSATKASEGFEPTQLIQGKWRIVLSAHAVLSERVLARLEVDAW